MRRYLVVPVVGACLLVLASGPPAFAGGHTVYAGKNSQGQKLRFTVDHTATGPKFDPTFLVQNVRCPVTGQRFTVDEAFLGFQIPIRHGKFNFVLNGLSNLVRWSGTVTSTTASGKESVDVASFDNEGGLQDCGVGSLSWAAKALAPGPSAAAVPSVAYVVKITKEPDGSVHYSISH
jgi:hypothetical protein